MLQCGPMRALVLLALLGVGCPGSGPDTDGPDPTPDDRDGDGVVDDLDCEPDDAEVAGTLPDVCDGVDNDCDGELDEDSALFTLHRDQDGDGYGDPTWTTESCVEITGWTGDETDCGPSDPTIYPGAFEHCDGLDHDCDGLTMENDSIDMSPWYLDLDGDGFGAGSPGFACEAPVGMVGNAEDCDDTRADVSPRAPEVCDLLDVDEDCDLLPNDLDDWVADGSYWYPDLDGDGWGDDVPPVWTCEAPQDYVDSTSDCNDHDPLVHPEAPELCNEVDDNCDDVTDEDAEDERTWYQDLDADGYGDATTTSTACAQPSGSAEVAGDCDDHNNTIHPSADESDCTGTVDLNCDGFTGETDNDGDGFNACLECDDGDVAVYPGADEVCNGVDDDCDGTTDVNALDGSFWYADSDKDGYGDPEAEVSACIQPLGYVVDATDCDDASRTTWPGAPETCANSDDDDCDGDANEIGAIACSDWYDDVDGDAFGDASVCTCVARGDYDVADGDDCDDGDTSVYPGASEVCGDSVDQDCDGADDDCTLASADSLLIGRLADDAFGSSLSAVGDTNGDGVDDLLVGALGLDNAVNEGGVELFEGPLVGTTTASRPEAFWYGEGASDYAGYAISNPADVDRDGVSEVLVGATKNDATGTNAGRAYLIEMSSGALGLSSVSLLTVSGETDYDALGSSVLMGTDVDDDGRSEAAIGAYGNDENGAESGAVYLFEMPTSGSKNATAATYIVRGDAHDRLALLPHEPTDVDGDGADDLVVGGWGIEGDALTSGGVAVFLGPISGDLAIAAADALIRGEATSDEAGIALDVRDADGDGSLDLLVGAPGNDAAGTDAGAGYLVLGPLSTSSSLSAAATVVRGETAGDNLGSAVAIANLLGGTSSALMFGAPGSAAGGANSGGLYRFNDAITGTFGGAEADASYPGESIDARLGTCVVNVGDTDGDGREDAGVCAPGYLDSSGVATGAVYVL
ncbi:hypothetical protein LBMAG42_02990 [Deltaproteobacteria bacterium]|nr:hypothetical protein LBMAG42_02990 [Deltaproteobacteria bacterium]